MVGTKWSYQCCVRQKFIYIYICMYVECSMKSSFALQSMVLEMCMGLSLFKYLNTCKCQNADFPRNLLAIQA